MTPKTIVVDHSDGEVRQHDGSVADAYAAELGRLRNERDRMRRLFNRLEAAVSHHKKAIDEAYEGAIGHHDDALYVARDKILKDYAEGDG